MKQFLLILIAFLLCISTAVSQSSSSLFPQTPNMKSVYVQTGLTIDEEEPEFELPNREILLENIEVGTTDGVPSTVFVYRNNDTELINEYLAIADTVFADALSFLNLGFFDELDLGLDVDFEFIDDIDIVRLAAEEDSSWPISDNTFTVDIPEDILDLVPSGVNIRDEMDVRIRTSVQRLDDKTVELPYGTFETVVFKPTLRIDLIVQIQVPLIGFQSFTLGLINNYGTELYFAEGHGIVKELLEPIEVVISNAILGTIELGEIPGYRAELLEFEMIVDSSTENEDYIANEFTLYPAYPNPFNPTTNIRYELVHNSNVSITVYNSLGQVVSTLLNDTRQSAGMHTLSVDMSTNSSGVYFYVVRARDTNGVVNQLTGSFTLLK